MSNVANERKTNIKTDRLNEFHYEIELFNEPKKGKVYLINMIPKPRNYFCSAKNRACNTNGTKYLIPVI